MTDIFLLTYNNFILLSQQILDPMQEEAKPSHGKINKVFSHYGLQCSLKDQTMCIEVTQRQSENIYWTQLSVDTIPEGMKVIFPTPSQIYEFFQEPTDSGSIQIPSLDRIIIKFKVGRNLVQIPIHLSRKELTNEEKLKRRISALQLQISELREKKQFQSFQDIKLQMEIQSQQITIHEQRVQIQDLKENISRMQNKSYNDRQIQTLKSEKMLLQEKLEQMKNQIDELLRTQQVYTKRINILQEQNHKYKKEKQNAQAAAINFQNEIKAHQLIISDLEQQLNEKQIQIAQLTGGKPSKPILQADNQKYGKLLVFEPLDSSVNKSCYNFASKTLTKNNSSYNGTGRMIPCAHPIPKNGRYHYKFINKNIGKHPNFRIGVISRSNLASQTYMNGGDVDAVMYYCYSTDKEIIYEGTTKLEGFNIYKGNLITIVIDRDKEQVQWFVENNFASLTKFTGNMKKAENLYFFIQLWSNGDALEMVTE